MRKGKKDIFISYCRKSGGLETAERIRDRLILLGYTVFMDLHNIELGKEFPATIIEAIRSCKEILLVLPPDIKDQNGNISNALENKWVKYEICYALKYDKRIIPILMEGYEFPDEDFCPNLPEEFQNSKEIENQYINIGKKNGIRIKNEYFDDNFKKIREALKSRRKWKLKKKILVFASIILSFLGTFIVCKCIYNAYLPLFSLSLVTDENNDDGNSEQSWNMKYYIVNKGGQMAGGRVKPSLRIGLKVVSKFESYDYKYGFFDIELNDFYEDSYFFDDQNNTVSIYETEADNLVTFICLMEEQLEKNDMYIDMYAIKNLFEIDYTDRFGVNHQEFYESENNYSYIMTSWGENENQDNDEGLVRYCSDNALVRVRDIDDAMISHPLLGSDSSQLEWEIKDNVKYINKHKNRILPTSVFDVIEAEDINGDATDVLTKDLGKAVEPIEDDAGLAIGLHLYHKECNNKEDLKWYERMESAIYDILR